MKNGIIITAVGFVLLLASFLFSEGSRLRTMEIVLFEGEYNLTTQEMEGDFVIPTRYALFFSFIVITTGVVKIILSKVNRLENKNLLLQTQNRQNLNKEIEVNKMNNTSAVENEIHQQPNEKGNFNSGTVERKPLLTSFKWLILIICSLFAAPLFAGIIFFLLFDLFTGESYSISNSLSSHGRSTYSTLYLAAFQAFAGLWTFFVLRSVLKKKSSGENRENKATPQFFESKN